MAHTERQSVFRSALPIILAVLSLIPLSAAAQTPPEIHRLITEAEKLRSNWTAESFQKANDNYRAALRLLTRTNNNSEKVRVLQGLAEVSCILGNYEEALTFYENALQTSQTLNDQARQAALLNGASYTYSLANEGQKALDYAKRALTLAEQHQNRVNEVEALNNLAEAYTSLGDLKSADSLIERLQPLARNGNDVRGQARAATTEATIDIIRGDGDKAVELLKEALKLWRTVGDPRNEAYTLQTLAAQKVFGGDYQQALDYAGQALDLFKRIGDSMGVAVATARIGYTYLSLGEPKTTLGYYKQALSIYKRLGLREDEATMLADLGDVYRLLGDQQLALAMCQESLAIIQKTGDKHWEGLILNSIGNLHLDNRNWKNALGVFNQAVSILHQIGDRRWEAEAHKGIGLVYSNMGNEAMALESFNRALDLARSIADPGVESSALYNIALVERRRGDLEKARLHVEEGLRIIDSLRAKVANKDSRASYFAFVHQQFELYVDVLMSLNQRQPGAGRDVAAFEASEKWRSRSLLEMLSESRTAISQTVDEALLRKERTLEQQLRTATERRIQLLSEKAPTRLLADTETELDTLVAEYQTLHGQIAASNTRYAAITGPAALTLKDIQQQVLDRDTILLEYSLGEERSFLWAVTTDSIRTFELPSRSQIEKLAREVYESLTARNREIPGETSKQRQARVLGSDQQFIEQSKQLSTILLGPVLADLNRTRILVVADGALHYLPFATLPLPAVSIPRADFTSLIVEHEVITLPSASVLAIIRKERTQRPRAAKSVAILADPVFDKDDDRLNARKSTQTQINAADGKRTLPDLTNRVLRDFDEQGLNSGIARLPFSRREADAIMASIPTRDALLALGFRANRITATAPELSQYRIIHFATHGLLNSRHPELSGILLSLYDEQGKPIDGFLQLHDIYNLNIPADLVVLSACQTALGKDMRGEGLIGLTRGFMYAGAARVVASLWQVDDSATAGLMAEFYRAMLKDNMRPAEALRAAQLHVWRENQWSSPYYWAAFTLQGEWR